MRANPTSSIMRLNMVAWLSTRRRHKQTGPPRSFLAATFGTIEENRAWKKYLLLVGCFFLIFVTQMLLTRLSTIRDEARCSTHLSGVLLGWRRPQQRPRLHSCPARPLLCSRYYVDTRESTLGHRTQQGLDDECDETQLMGFTSNLQPLWVWLKMGIPCQILQVLLSRRIWNRSKEIEKSYGMTMASVRPPWEILLFLPVRKGVVTMAIIYVGSMDRPRMPTTLLLLPVAKFTEAQCR